MANTTEMLRLMRHAANLLDGCEPSDIAEIALQAAGADDRRFVIDTTTRQAAAIAMGSAVLRMIAAAIDDEPSLQSDPATQP